jgi:hypothetical protein
MDIPSEEYKSNVNRSGSFSTILYIVQGIARWLTGIFTITEEERSNAGISVGRERHDG